MTEHTHDHKHTHTHTRTAMQPASEEERLALLKYMLDHNTHHAEELHDLAHGLTGEASDLLHEAVSDIESSNAKLAAALKILTK